MRIGTCVVLSVLGLAGCGSSGGTTANGEPTEIRHVNVSTIPTANGDAYAVTRVFKSDEDYDGEFHIWFVSGSRKEEVQIKCGFPDITPLADGTAILKDGVNWWRLKGNQAQAIESGTTSGEPKRALREGFYFVRWYLADQDKEGLTETDREEHMRELQDDAAADAEGDRDY